jgi:excisionase family DNA binding protein
MDTPIDQPVFRTRKETGKVLRVSTAVVDSEIRTGRLKAHRFGRLVRIDSRDLEDYIRRSTGGQQ